MPIANTPLTAARRTEVLAHLAAAVETFLAASEELAKLAGELDSRPLLDEARDVDPENVREELRLVTASRGHGGSAYSWLLGRVSIGESLEQIAEEGYGGPDSTSSEWQAIKAFEERFAAAHPELMPFLNAHPTELAKPPAEAADRIYAAVEAMMLEDEV